MNFFRLRIVNTALVLFIGLLLGYILRDPAAKRAAGPYIPVYPRGYEADKPAQGSGLQAPAPAAREKSAAPKTREAPPAEKADDPGEDYALPVKAPLEADYEVTYGAGPVARKPAAQAAAQASPEAAPAAARKPETDQGLVKGAEDAFFKNPERYAAQYLEMELQMVVARKTQAGWVLNLVHARGGKNIDYIYIEDDFLLGEQPDLRIGYFYNVSFKCGKGNPNSDNKLLGINPSGRKAAWATGVSALE
ncbi:MAG: hypothetical protein A3J79_11635 [Elusimicrobia bacterium RIFOXYB2_FULL_62_6]|nr:MAG: hypothetical protein A3J79_11635 [Elusimicrobia bacterium RIFOXYB2_FULL_62_6]